MRYIQAFSFGMEFPTDIWGILTTKISCYTWDSKKARPDTEPHIWAITRQNQVWIVVCIGELTKPKKKTPQKLVILKSVCFTHMGRHSYPTDVNLVWQFFPSHQGCNHFKIWFRFIRKLQPWVGVKFAFSHRNNRWSVVTLHLCTARKWWLTC